MSDLVAGLRRLAERADEAALPPASTIRAAGDRRTRRRVVAVAGGAGVAAAAVAVAALAVAGGPGTSRDDAPPPAGHTSSPTPSPTVPTEPAEELVEDAWGRGYVDQNAVAADGSTFVMVADAGRAARFPAWWSEDGRTWTRASGPESANLTDVIATDAGFLATGVDADGAAAFWSADGRTWEQTADLPRVGEVDALWGVAETDRGYFVWGRVGSGPRLYRSDDGRTWAATDLEAPSGRGADTSLCAVEDEPGGRLTATGSVRDGRLGSEHVATWSSDDGGAWGTATLTEEDGITTCNRLWEAHWSASTGAGTVRIEPYGEPGRLYLTPAG